MDGRPTGAGSAGQVQPRLAAAARRVPPGPGRDAVAAAVLAVLLTGAPVLGALAVRAHSATGTRLPSTLLAATVLSILGCVPVALRRRRPRAALVLATALVLAGVAQPLASVAPGLAVLVCTYTVGTRMPWQAAARVIVPCASAHAAGGYLLTPAGSAARGRGLTYWGVLGRDLPDVITATVASYTIAYLVGAYVRSRRARTEQLREHADRLEAEREQRDRAAAAAERNRIARELHDIAAHDLSAIVVQAGAADRLVDRDPGAARDTLHAIRAQGRETLGALRELVGILREDDADGRAPQPTLARLDELVTAARSAGLGVELVQSGDPAGLPAILDLTGYRVVQEALTNARRHAPGAGVQVTVRYSRGVDIAVRNAAPRRPAPPPETGTGAGHGLAGMRERVGQAGGSLTAGPTADGGWQVHARLPNPRPEAG